MHLSRYLKMYPAKDRPDHFLLFSTLRLSVALLSAETLRLIEAGSGPEAELQALTRIGMLVSDPAEEKEQMRTMLERANGQSRSFMAMAVLNLDCNLNCGYCYEADFRGGQYMSEATADLLVETLLRDRICRGYDVTIAFYISHHFLIIIQWPYSGHVSLYKKCVCFCDETVTVNISVRRAARSILSLSLSILI